MPVYPGKRSKLGFDMSDRSERLIKIAVVDDIHDRWEEDNLALQSLGVDLALFLGDFCNELAIIGINYEFTTPKSPIC